MDHSDLAQIQADVEVVDPSLGFDILVLILVVMIGLAYLAAFPAVAMLIHCSQGSQS